MVDLFSSKTGLFAAIVAVIGLLVAVQTLLMPYIVAARERRHAEASLRMTPVDVSAVAPSSNSCELRFGLVGGGGRGVVVTAVLLGVSSVKPSETIVASVPEAPLNVYAHRVELRPDATSYDIRSRVFTAEVAPLRVSPGEVEAFVVKLVSMTSHVYDVHVTVQWYDVNRPEDQRSLRSEDLNIDFPARVA